MTCSIAPGMFDMRIYSEQHPNAGKPPLYLLVDKQWPAVDFKHLVCHMGGPEVGDSEKIQTLHVMSRPAGGEVRGYFFFRCGLYLRGYSRVWDEVDREVERILGIKVRPFEEDMG